ncbi:DUF302 domain-containing protein [Geopsychrobacter electrodiphilus]|uniref:DUF302 domain-containing protein n=1 Tax=Geopsychrobacter electrodiphilus TaxID=225196 RepID=UPI00035CD146|nr:DUF302 domain-containing protein [Geopsychrobacter electrodiphilus]
MRTLLIAVMSLFIALPAVAAEGLVSLPSQHSVSLTADRLVSLLESKGMTVFNRIDHAAAAQKVGVELRPTTLVIFGNPKVGSPLMKCSQTTAIDLPQKALIWQDENQQVWFSYNDPTYLKDRHQIEGCDQNLKKISAALANFALGATKK